MQPVVVREKLNSLTELALGIQTQQNQISQSDTIDANLRRYMISQNRMLLSYNIKWGAGTNVVTVTVANDGTIDGAESFIFNEQYDTGSSITVINNGTGVWYII